jgi:transcriptional regulator with XRE-family HTH domain
MRDNGLVLKATMTTKKETVDSIHEKTGISKSHLRNIRGGYDPSLRTKLKIAEALNVSVHYLFTLAPEEIEVLYSKDRNAEKANEG